ncbi:aminotransferase class IV [Sunxiuqinia indica]|uniref:aminotransferase class IV n=1 Tax=Sunxiuqinia indica TaxID=2692584 RepID=UPI001358CEB6|nr:aminotransferase class IV [Sunxiuqinia indica]
MRTNFLLNNGQFEQANEKVFPFDFLENVLFCEQIRSVRNLLPFWSEHLQLIELKLRLLGANPAPFLQNNGKELKRQIERTLTKNKFFKSSHIKLYLTRENETIGYVIQANPIESTSFALNTVGLSVNIFEKAPKDFSLLSSLDFGSMPIWKIVEAEKLKASYDELLLINSKQAILETPGKNIYVVRENQVLTPSPTCGAYIDPVQSAIAKTLKISGMELTATEDLREEYLLKADEVFVANSLNGIQWIKAFKQKRYFNKKVKVIQQEFNRLVLV